VSERRPFYRNDPSFLIVGEDSGLVDYDGSAEKSAFARQERRGHICAIARSPDQFVHLMNPRVCPCEVSKGIRIGVELGDVKAFFIQRCAASAGKKMPCLF
jgi:hypothetical protein